jgi:hypothetical protein
MEKAIEEPLSHFLKGFDISLRLIEDFKFQTVLNDSRPLDLNMADDRYAHTFILLKKEN